METNRKIWIAAGLTLFFIVIGTIGYSRFENFSLLDAFYMTVITISTVGFGEINELTATGRIFTIFLILSGVGSIAFAIHAFTESMIEKASNPNQRKKAMKKKIERLNGHFIICGHGRVGAAAADHFYKMGAGFVVIEASEKEISVLEEKGYYHMSGDATSEKMLLNAGIKKASALLALLNSDPENLFTVLTARELNPTLNIIARTEVASSESRILRAGADSVISPYASAGRRVADRTMALTTVSLQDENGVGVVEKTNTWVTVTEENELAQHTVEAASDLVKGDILGIRRQGKDIILPNPEFQLKLSDELFVSCFRTSLAESSNTLQPKRIVLVDDNPVIRRLYTRLFQKAGFSIMTAENGKEGLDLILSEMPDAAVIDYMLPDFSGLEICRQIRKNSEGDNIRLFLFTADEQEKTKEKAMAVGVETVVVKSPEATEIISMVKNVLG